MFAIYQLLRILDQRLASYLSPETRLTSGDPANVRAVFTLSITPITVVLRAVGAPCAPRHVVHWCHRVFELEGVALR